MPDLFTLLELSAIAAYLPTRWGDFRADGDLVTDPLSDTAFAGLCWRAMLVYFPTRIGLWLVFYSAICVYLPTR